MCDCEQDVVDELMVAAVDESEITYAQDIKAVATLTWT